MTWPNRPPTPAGSAPALPRIPAWRPSQLIGRESLGWSIHQTSQEPTATYFSTFARAWELILGALLAVCVPYLGRLPETFRAVLGWAGLAGIALAAVRFDQTTPFPGSAALLPTVATAAVLAGGALAPRFGVNRLLERQPLRFTGDISYSLYLWHWPLLILGAAYAGHELQIRQNLLLVVVAFALAAMSYYWVENPFRRARVVGLAQQRRSLRLWPVAATSVVVVAALGFAILPSQLATLGAAPVSAVTPAGAAEVKQSVLAARAADPLPSNLEPGLEGLLADVTTIGDCSGYKHTSSKICQFGDPNAARTMVLIGNSHAVAWLPALSAAAKSAGWQLFPVVKEACDYPGYLGDPTGECAQWYRWAIPQIAALKPDLIVMNGYSAGDGWRSAMEQAIVDLKPLGSKVLILSDPPGVGAKPFDCLQRRDATLATCAFPIRPGTIVADDEQAEMAAAAGVEFVNIRSWFCYDMTCPSVVGNRVVYADVGHISKTYAAHLAPLLATDLHLSG